MGERVLIVGGGVIGLGIARELHKRGQRDIAVVDRSVCGGEASWAAAGMLSPQVEADGPGTFFDLTLASRDMFPRFAGELLDETDIDVGLERSGTLSLRFAGDGAADLIERSRWQRAVGLACELLSAEELTRLEPYISALVAMGVHFPNDWQVDNRLLLDALRRYAELNDIRLIENTSVTGLVIDGDRVTGVRTANKVIEAGETIVATGAWTSDIVPAIDVRPIRGQMICIRAEPGQFQHVMFTKRGYVVPRADGRLLVGSTSEDAGFVKEVTGEAVEELQEMASDISPFLRLDVADSWSGLRPRTPDKLPVIGRVGGFSGLTLATGHYRNGILLAPVTARMIADEIVDGRAAEAAFSPDRFTAGRVSSNHA